jgi:hypothetical protein
MSWRWHVHYNFRLVLYLYVDICVYVCMYVCTHLMSVSIEYLLSFRRLFICLEIDIDKKKTCTYDSSACCRWPTLFLVCVSNLFNHSNFERSTRIRHCSLSSLIYVHMIRTRILLIHRLTLHSDWKNLHLTRQSTHWRVRANFYYHDYERRRTQEMKMND